jgi:hypothetical protein
MFQYSFSITLIDGFGMPVVGYPPGLVSLNIAAPCVNPVIIPPAGPSNAAGVMTWPAAALNMPGGSCVGPVFVTIAVAGGCSIPIPYVTSPDEDGNGIVDLADLARYGTAFNAGGPLANGDLNRDFAIGLPDLSLFQQHFVAP